MCVLVSFENIEVFFLFIMRLELSRLKAETVGEFVSLFKIFNDVMKSAVFSVVITVAVISDFFLIYMVYDEGKLNWSKYLLSS